ncbi:MAG: hypothetical protein R3F19_19490 [Verrucomicrobiales bacterium]
MNYDIIEWGNYRIAVGVKSRTDAEKLLNDNIDGFGFDAETWGGNPNSVADLVGYKCLVIDDCERFSANFLEFAGSPEYISLTGRLSEIRLSESLYQGAKEMQIEIGNRTLVSGSLPGVKQLTLLGRRRRPLI